MCAEEKGGGGGGEEERWKIYIYVCVCVCFTNKFLLKKTRTYVFFLFTRFSKISTNSVWSPVKKNMLEIPIFYV